LKNTNNSLYKIEISLLLKIITYPYYSSSTTYCVFPFLIYSVFVQDYVPQSCIIMTPRLLMISFRNRKPRLFPFI